MPRDAITAKASRFVHGFAWALVGHWTVLMSFLFYIFKGRLGLRDLGYAPQAGVGHEWEESLTYFALVLYVTALRAMLIP